MYTGVFWCEYISNIDVNGLFQDVHGSGLITVRLLSYENPTGRDNSGKCCGGLEIPECQAVRMCNHFFDVCIG